MGQGAIEAILGRSLQHQHIVAVLDVDVRPGRVWAMRQQRWRASGEDGIVRQQGREMATRVEGEEAAAGRSGLRRRAWPRAARSACRSRLRSSSPRAAGSPTRRPPSSTAGICACSCHASYVRPIGHAPPAAAARCVMCAHLGRRCRWPGRDHCALRGVHADGGLGAAARLRGRPAHGAFAGAHRRGPRAASRGHTGPGARCRSHARHARRSQRHIVRERAGGRPEAPGSGRCRGVACCEGLGPRARRRWCSRTALCSGWTCTAAARRASWPLSCWLARCRAVCPHRRPTSRRSATRPSRCSASTRTTACACPARPTWSAHPLSEAACVVTGLCVCLKWAPRLPCVQGARGRPGAGYADGVSRLLRRCELQDRNERPRASECVTELAAAYDLYAPSLRAVALPLGSPQ